MFTDDKPARTWREIARELAAEIDTARILALSEELNQALAEEERRRGGPLRLDDFKDDDRRRAS